MSKLHAALDAFLVVLLCFIASIGWTAFSVGPQAVGVALPQGSAVFETSLQSRISASDTSMTLVSNALRGGETLSGYNCFTIDEGRSDSEFVCGTVSGTTVSDLERGLSFSTGTTTVSSLRFAHRVGANVKITDFPLIQRMRHQLSGTDTIASIIRYASHPIFNADTDIIDKKYVDDIAFSGASVIDATASARGVSELATQLETASSSSAGSSGPLVIPASNATSTYNSATAPLRVVVTQNNGFIDPRFLTLASSTHATTSVSFGWGKVAIRPPLAAPAATNTIIAFSGTAPYQMSFVEQDWVLVSSTTTVNAMNAATTTTITGASPASYKELKVFIRTTGQNASGLDDIWITFNNDFGANYGLRSFDNGSQVDVRANSNDPGFFTTATTSPLFAEFTISNIANQTKLFKWDGSVSITTSAAAPVFFNGVGVWNNTSSAITSITFKNRDTSTFSAGTVITVYGRRN